MPTITANHPPHEEHHGRRLLREYTVNIFWVAVISLACMYGFFLVLGGLDPFESVGAALIPTVLLVLIALRIPVRHAHHEEITHDPRLKHARERRGF